MSGRTLPRCVARRGDSVEVGGHLCTIDGAKVEDQDGDFVLYFRVVFSNDASARAAQLAVTGLPRGLEVTVVQGRRRYVEVWVDAECVRFQ